VEDAACMIGQPLQHLRVCAWRSSRGASWTILPARTARSIAEKGDELGVRVLELEASGQLDRLLAGSESLRSVRGRPYNAREEEDGRQYAI
jgi:hypothetical protein